MLLTRRGALLAKLIWINLLIATASYHANASSIPMINFEEKTEIQEWRVVNDTVMGGLSRAGLDIIDGSAFFYGILSLRNNGGFASVRRPLRLTSLSNKALVRVRVVGDGKTYQLRFRMDGYYDGVSYSASFTTLQGEVSEHIFSLTDFKASFRGRQVIDAPALSWPSVRQVALMISEKQEGKFKLLVDSITWFEQA
ncbi:CIA30 family protein [Glaciecola sp. KUL10]|uniref:CIA30 family protein n=1 Tax=Glaciecola sp. (strain KUL10) TaxID=2161813 RepID=UPI000D784D6A|nr:CIA30 family protein [Glaciecola sp. KUL10]